nr:hypothetical protein [Tanacetum cinerariifolium]
MTWQGRKSNDVINNDESLLDASHVSESSSRWGKQKANNVFQNHPKTVMHIVRRRAPTHCTDTDIVTTANGDHVQNAAPKGTSSTVWKAFQDPVKHNVRPDLNNVWVNHNLRSQSAPSAIVNTERVAQPNPSSFTNHRISTQYKGLCAGNNGEGSSSAHNEGEKFKARMTMGKENVKEPVPRDLPVVQTYVPSMKFLGPHSKELNLRSSRPVVMW